MKIFYIENARIPNEKAHGIQILKTCEALASLGHDVTLLLPRRKNHLTADPFIFYTIKRNFKIKYIASIDTLFLGRIGYWLQTCFFSEWASFYVRLVRPNIIYSRNELILLNMVLIHPHLVWEAHRGTLNWGIKMLLKKAKIITITQGLLDVYKKYIRNELQSAVIPDAVDKDMFDVSISPEEARKEYGLPFHKKIALYAGHLYEWKGAQVLADAALQFQMDEIAVFVGGTEHEVLEFKHKNRENKHIIILGAKKHEEIPVLLKAADVLVLPNSGKEAISRFYTSPLKLFEYMASKKPIVASDLPSLREILDEKNAMLVTSDNPNALAEGIRTVFENDELAQNLAAKAFEDKRLMSWKERAQKIAVFIEKQ